MSARKTPNHVAIIPDGNRRWAKERKYPTIEGHRRGADVAVKTARYLRSLGIHTLTLWAFSTENWSRPGDEVKYLMVLYSRMIDNFVKEAEKDNVRITHLGRKDRLPESLLKKIFDVEEKTKNNTAHQLNIALDYGGRDEILRTIQKMQELKQTLISEEILEQFLDTHSQKHSDPDIIIRTSGEQRTSGLMIWQAAYAEYFFLDKYFPELSNKDIDIILEEYNERERRFGK